MESKNPERDASVNLFGELQGPIRDRRGRKSYKKDKENQAFVARRAAAGWSQSMIAVDMGIDEKTLRKHFSRELEYGRVFMTGELLDILHRKAREGDRQAIRMLFERIDSAVPLAPRGRAAEKDDDDDDAPVRLGKKELRQQAAQNVPGNYGDIFERLRRH